MAETQVKRKTMKILIDIGHPAHVHLFRNFYFEMKKRGFSLLVTVKNIPSAKRLLDIYSIDYIDIGSKPDTIRGKFFAQLRFNWRLKKIVKKNKINLGIGSSITLAHVSKISRMKSFVFDDDDSEVQPLFAKFAHPFADFLVSPDVLAYERRKKNHLTYAGYHELAYLHPRRFKPDYEVIKKSGLKPGDVFFVLRFNIFKAHHDKGVHGLTIEQKKQLIDLLKSYGKIFIATEREIEREFSRYRLKISPEKIHSLLYYANMFIGDSQTMTSEAAVLGTPAVKCNSLAGKLSVPNEIEKRYGLCFSFLPEKFPHMINKIKELLNIPNQGKKWAKKRAKLISEKIDVTSFMVWLIENYPESLKIIKENPDYHKKFL